VVEENKRREAAGTPALVLVYDMVYWMLTFGDTRHVHPVGVVPEVAPYVVLIDAISKSFAATGLRVGWGIVPPHIQGKYKALIGHMGAWAPRPEQQATAWFLKRPELVDAFMDEFVAAIGARLDCIHGRFEAMQAAGLPVRALKPQGAIYLSIQIDLRGRRLPNGEVVETNEQVREYLLDQALIAVVPFQAFGLEGETGWFRMSVGAVGLDELAAGLDRLEAAVRAVS
jgi:aspartate aminotransferase